MLRKVPQPQLPQIYASGQRVSPTLRFKLYGSHFEMGRNCYTHTIFCFNVKQDGRGRDVYLFFILPAVVFLIFHLVISVFSFQKLSLATVKWVENFTPSQLVERLTFSACLIADFTFFCIRLLCPSVYFLILSDSEPSSWIIPSFPSLHKSYFTVKNNQLSVHHFIFLFNCSFCNYSFVNLLTYFLCFNLVLIILPILLICWFWILIKVAKYTINALKIIIFLCRRSYVEKVV